MSTKYRADVLVVGAGPAGMGAAIEAARAGAKTIVVDGFSRAGGQYWIQPPSHLKARESQVKEGTTQIAELKNLGVEMFSNSEVWGVLPGNRVLARGQNDESIEFIGKTLVVCTGAHDLVYPFPGWTLPGVMTAGGGQRFAKLSGKSPGNRVVVAGSGIFLWAVAASVVKAGGNLVGLVEARRNRLAVMNLLMRYPEKWIEAYRLLLPVIRAGTPLLAGQFVKSAKGNGHLESICVGPLSNNGSKISEDRNIEADCLLVSHGFRPITEITSLLRCAHDFNPRKGGWFCKTDFATGATSVETVFAAGEVTGVAGARPGFLRGALAGLSAAQSIGFSSGNLNKKRQRICQELKRAQAFADKLGEMFEPLPGMASLVANETLVCRCEEVTWGEVLTAWNDGADNLYGIKLWTRIGMGRCQGRICGDALAALLADKFNADQEQLLFNQPRLPIRPVSLSQVQESLSAD